MQKNIRLSVHMVVDSLLRQGSIDSRVFSTSTMQEGTRLHALYQKEQGTTYQSEVLLSATFSIDDFNFLVEGRADGVIAKEDGSITIDEIKTTIADLDQFYNDNMDWHLGQAKLYAYMYAISRNKDRVGVRLTYISQNDYRLQEKHYFSYTIDELRTFALDLMDRFYQSLKTLLIHQEDLANSIKFFKFPYPNMREGQGEMIKTLEEAKALGKFAYVEAPTGIGKTAASLFPYVKDLQNGAEKVFYLTSKNSIKKVALDTVKHFNKHGAKLKAISLSSKDSLCINDKKRHCNPDDCPFARDYYKKLSDVLFLTFVNHDYLDFDTLLALGLKHELCPFEFQLDLSLYYDIIIADYNHLFHPTARLMRFFDSGPRPYYLLVDECHNLPSRIRDMHSASINYYDLYDLNKSLKPLGKRALPLRKRIGALLDFFISIDKNDYESIYNYSDVIPLPNIPDEFISLAERFEEAAKSFLKDEASAVDDQFLETYYNVRYFLEVDGDSPYYSYYLKQRNSKCYELVSNCLDSRPFMKPALSIFLSGVFFSATLAPTDFYFDLLKAEDDSPKLILKSPFPPQNTLLLINTFISTKYKDRSGSLVYLHEAITSFIKGKIGNYLVFFPSYIYMRQFLEILSPSESYDIYIQDERMDQNQRETFLQRFKPNPSRTTVGFVVMGGIFSEGIDLIEDRLIGAIIVGVGLPSICYDNDQLRRYYGEEDEEKGYEYSYLYPGINKVFQAAGRVIRSEEDKGLIMLIDQRYSENRYKEIYEPRYPNRTFVFQSRDILQAVQDFYKEER